MSKRNLLLEIGLEEMPARMVTDAMNQLQAKVEKWLNENRISFEGIRAFSTPRRLALAITDVAEIQSDIEEEAKGPAKKIAVDSEGNWSKAAMGFARGQGVSVDDFFFKEVKGIEYVYVNKHIQGRPTIELLGELESIVTSLTFPKNMRWGHEELRFVRPIKWIVALFGNDVIDFSITNVQANSFTRGHRFLGKEIEITDLTRYEALLEEQFVIADPVKRKNIIREQLKALEKENNWIIPVDEDLLEEVNNLVEYPTALYGTFEEEFLEIPQEVLITSMKEHQRYFPVKDESGKLLPFFVTVRNGNSDNIETVARGNAKVLRARLADAAFFYREDQKVSIENCMAKLDTTVYHEDLGTIGDKVRRTTATADMLATTLNLTEQEKKQVHRAASICKFDLVTHMVYEFPELQGVMGEKYALLTGEDAVVAKAINEHYMPRHAEDDAPATNVGSVVSIADKIDTIVGCFSIGLIPTGSQDPYALRRQASGIVSIALTKGWDLNFTALFEQVVASFIEKGLAKRSQEEIVADLVSFFKLRVKNVLNEKGVNYDVIDAVLDTPLTNVNRIVGVALVLEKKRSEENFKGITESLSRVLNISSKGTAIEINPALFEVAQENDLYEAYMNMKENYATALEDGQLDEAFAYLASLSPTIDAYFEDVMVMSKDEAIKANRLGLMVAIATMIFTFANFNLLIVK
ncbi:MAG: glycine--tRNA ligase subunit beta [Bacillaceae bacterium]